MNTNQQTVSKQEQIQEWIRQGVDPEVAKRVAAAKPAKANTSSSRGHLNGGNREFSLLR